jgi:hypothetical protein
MNTINEDELLRSLIKKAGMVKAPDNLTSRVMEQIMANPGIEPARKFYYDWWWSGFAVLCIISLYFTGVFGFIAGAFSPWFIEAYNLISGYVVRLAGLFPSTEVMLPSSLLLPVLLPGILLILLIDAVFGRDLRRAV